MRAASLLAVFLLAKLAVLAAHSAPLTIWTPFAYLWHDAAVVLVFVVFDSLLPARAAWVCYAILALYAALNIPVGRVLATHLTWPMLRAAGGPLADSILFYATWSNVLLLAAAIAAACLLPRLFLRVFRNVPTRSFALALAAFVIAGPIAGARVDSRGLERNAWTALVLTAIPRLGGGGGGEPGEWRTMGFDRTRHEDLARFRGAAAGRNVVLVSLESTAAQYLGIHGAEPDPMPRLSELARNAIVFNNAYAVYPESIKGLFSWLCSIYPSFDTTSQMYAAAPCRSIAAILKEQGYRTALFHSGRFIYLGMQEVIRNRGFDTLADAGNIGGNHESSFGVDEPATVARILQWIDALPAGQRFFVAYMPVAGHHPYETPERGPFPDNDEIGRYRNSLRYGDNSLGTLIDGIRARGHDRSTLWIVFGDHGEAFGQHEGNYGHTFHLYDENIRVPFLVAAPGLISATLRSGQVVSLVDTAPTVLDLLSVAAPENYQGGSMLDAEPRMAFFFADYSLGLLGLRDGPRKFILELDSGRSKLFDLVADPAETSDLSRQMEGQARWYAANLRNWSIAQKRRLRGPK